MKAKLALFLIVVMILSLAGCKSEKVEQDASAATVVAGDSESEKEDVMVPSKPSEQQPQTQTPAPEASNPSEQPDQPTKEELTVEAETRPPVHTPPAEEEEPKVEEVEIDYSAYIKIASYNIQNLAGGSKKDKVVEVLKAIDADIVGLQEVDVYTSRGGSNVNQAELLAKECGYPYWHFTKSIDYGGGSYGHAILSRYPIKSATAVNFKVISAGDHNRNYGRHVVDVNGTELVVYNTHMTLGNDQENGAEMTQVTAAMAKDQYAVLTGDMNMWPDNMGRYVNIKKVTVLNGGDEFVFYVNTFPQGNNPTSPIDNIVVTKTLKHYWSDDNNVGIEVVHTEGSDHNPIYTYVNFKE